jgi:hypothetical protein
LSLLFFYAVIWFFSVAAKYFLILADLLFGTLLGGRTLHFPNSTVHCLGNVRWVSTYVPCERWPNPPLLLTAGERGRISQNSTVHCFAARGEQTQMSRVCYDREWRSSLRHSRMKLTWFLLIMNRFFECFLRMISEGGIFRKKRLTSQDFSAKLEMTRWGVF